MVNLVMKLDLIGFSFPGCGFGQNVLIFGADVGFSAHTDISS